jgi:hypothetical protein
METKAANAAISKEYDGPVLISTGLPFDAVPKWLGVSHGLSDRTKWIFILSNAPYFLSAWLIATSESVPTACSWHCLTGACAAPSFHGAMVLGLAVVSTYWHGAQCELLPRLYFHSPESIALLQSALWQQRLIVGDIACSILTFLVGVRKPCSSRPPSAQPSEALRGAASAEHILRVSPSHGANDRRALHPLCPS